MAFIHGKNADVRVSGNNISTYLDTADLSIDTDVAETSTFGSDWKGNTTGQSMAKLDLAGKYDATASTGPIVVLEGLRDTATEVKYFPQGSGSGLHVYTGDMVLGNLTASSPVGGIVAFKASLVSDGAFTRGAA